MVLVAAGPCGHVRKAWEHIAFVVVASAIGQDEVLHGVDAAAYPGDEVIGLRGGAEGLAALEAPAVLQGRDAVSQDRGRKHPVGSEQVTVQVQFGSGHPVELRDHPGPMQLDQRADQRPEPDEFIARAGKQPDGGPAGTVAAQPGQRDGLPWSPAEFVDEREDGIGGPDRLQPRKGLVCDGDLDLIQHRRVVIGQPLAGRVPRGRPGSIGARGGMR